ncbi:MAG TPA: helix-turn-helix domain-containing protein [Dehalococcoidia bacterium]|nr:helix-turn-helix domain-containing protein [Dehalococcoidia bacterium]
MNGNGNGHSGAGAQTGVAETEANQTGAAQRVRADALPEFTRYRDEGCDFHPSCLTCPLPRCRYDEPGGVRALLNVGRDREILQLRRRQGLAVETLAERYGVSRRTVFRILQRGNP